MKLHPTEEKGMTFVEVMVALPIAGLLVAGVAGMYYQMVTTHSFVDGQLAAGAEAQASGAWFSQDTVQAQVVQDGNYGDDETLRIEAPQDAAIPGTEVLCLEWTDWNDDAMKIVYSLVSVPGSPLRTLHRTVHVNETVTESHDIGHRLDDSSDPDTLMPSTRFEWATADKETVRFLVASVFGEETVTRIYEARPRSAAP